MCRWVELIPSAVNVFDTINIGSDSVSPTTTANNNTATTQMRVHNINDLKDGLFGSNRLMR